MDKKIKVRITKNHYLSDEWSKSFTNSEEFYNILWWRKVSVGVWEASCAVRRSDEDIAR